MTTAAALNRAGVDAAPKRWYQIENKADGAEVYLYDEVGAWGVSAGEFVKELRNVTGTTIDLHINSPGGDVFDGMAIFNALRAHKAAVSVTVDGIAASAASFIAMAGDTITMARNAQLMIHEAHAVAVGSAKEMSAMADLLGRCSDNIANIYADRAGGSTAEWRDRMRTETWYTADEAVKAGLADGVAPPSAKGPRNSGSWDLSVFNFAGRAHAPDPFAQPAARVPDPPPPIAPPTVDPAPEPGFFMPEFDPAVLRDAIADLQDIPFDPEIFRAAVALVANDSPAPEAPRTPDPVSPEPDMSIDLPAFRRSIREARL